MIITRRSTEVTTPTGWLASFDPPAFEATQLRHAGQIVLLFSCTASLAGYYIFAALAHYYSGLRGILGHRMFALYWPLIGHTSLLLSLYALDGYWQERVFLSWQVAQVVCACASVISLWMHHEEGGIVFAGWLLNGVCFASTNILFYLRVLDGPHVWKLSGGLFSRATFCVAICFNLTFLSGYMCRTLRASIATAKGEKEE